MILTKARALPRNISAMTTLKFVKGVVVTTTSLRSVTVPSIWLSSTRNLLANKFKETCMKHTSLLDASCSKDTPLENNDEKTPPQMDDLLSTDDMLVEFQSMTNMETTTSFCHPQILII